MNNHKSQQENKSSFASKPKKSRNQTKVLLPDNEDVKCTRKYGNPKMVKFGT